MKSYPPDPMYVENQRRYNWKHVNGQVINQDDIDKSKEIASILKEYIADNMKGFDPRYILVLGCRAGYECEALMETFEALVVGVDIVPEFIELACKKSPAQCGDMHYLDFPDDIFDLTVCEGTLEHCWSPLMAVNEMRRVTKKLVFLTVDLEKDRGAFKSHYSFSMETEEWLELYRDAGFSITKHWLTKAYKHEGLYAILEKDS